ncbi:MAG: protein kinase [Clostridium sp.]|nr:protein kinase [Clostridium sp.]
MYLWTNEEIEAILIQIEEQGYPFPKYSFTRTAKKFQLLGRGGAALVYEAALKENPKKKYAVKVIGFGEKHVDSEFFKSTVEAQKSIGLFQDNIVKIYDYTELPVWVDGNNRVFIPAGSEQKPCPQELGDCHENQSATGISTSASVEPSEKDFEGGCLKLQFILMEKLTPVLSREKSGKVKLYPAALAAYEEKEILRLAYDIGKGLAAAHGDNVLHRDVKLENIFYAPKSRRYKLGDFGIAKLADNGLASTVAFTKGYGAPEVVGSAEKYDNTADIYSFGMLLYVLLNGLKFPGADAYYVNSKEQYRQGYVLPRPIYGSDELYVAIEKMCRYYPDDRYQSMDEVLNDLEKLIFHPSISYKREHKKASFAVGTAFLFLGAAAWKLIFRPEMAVEFSAAMYLFFALSIGKWMLYLAKRDIIAISMAILGLGIYLLAAFGFSWIKLLLLICAVFSSGNFVGLFAGSALSMNIAYLVTEKNLVMFQNGRSFRWAAVALLSLAAVLLFQYSILEQRDRTLIAIYLKGNRYWVLVCMLYAMTFVYGVSMRSGSAYGILSKELVQELITYDLAKAGAAGFCFCILWAFREKILASRRERKV